MRRRRAMVVAVATVVVAAALVWILRPGEGKPLRASLSESTPGLLRWDRVEGAEGYVLELADGSVEIGPDECGTEACEVVVDATLTGGVPFRVSARAGDAVLARSDPIGVPAPAKAPLPPLFDVLATVAGPDGPEFKVYPASSPAQADAIRERLRADPTILDAEPDAYAELLQARGGGRQDGLWPARALDLAAAHSITKGAGAMVAVLDSGVWANHPDLRGRVLPGIDIPARRAGVHRPGTRLPTQHATSVAGVIAARGGGSRPLGVAPQAEILPVNVQGHEKAIRTTSIAEGIMWATKAGARIINISIAAPVTSRAVAHAVAYAASKDVLVVAGTGNTALDPPRCGRRRAGKANYRPYPASFADVVAVGGTTPDGRVWKCSHRGDYLDLVAPATTLKLLNNSARLPYRMSSGTSYSGPAVAATAALLLSVDPSLSRQRLVELLETTAKPGRGARAYGRGLVSPHDALVALRGGPAAAQPAPSEQALVEDPAALAGMPPFDHLNCAAHLQPTTYLRAQDDYTRYTVWIRPPRRTLPQRDRSQALSDSLIAVEVASRAYGHGPYSGPARSVFYGLGRSTSPADYTVSYDADHRVSVSGPVVRIFEPDLKVPSPQPLYNLRQHDCEPEAAFRKVAKNEAAVIPGEDEFWYLEVNQLVVEDPAVEPGRYALLVFFDGVPCAGPAMEPAVVEQRAVPGRDAGPVGLVVIPLDRVPSTRSEAPGTGWLQGLFGAVAASLPVAAPVPEWGASREPPVRHPRFVDSLGAQPRPRRRSRPPAGRTRVDE